MTFYEVLGVSETATVSEIHTAYKELAWKLHPDLGGDTQKFASVNEAYWELTRNRKNYDALLALTRKKCETCEGTGIIQQRKGFKIISESECADCKGRGQR